MNPRLRVALAILGVIIVTLFVVYELYSVMLSPLLQWQEERTEDRATYQKVAGLSARTEVEQTLSDWKAEPMEGTHYCGILLKRSAGGGDSCKAADHEVAYQRQRTIKREAPLTPLRIIVVYDRRERVVTASTLD